VARAGSPDSRLAPLLQGLGARWFV